ncbi:hypothetical protein ACMFMG_002780 [Clarireedia jacksonii]
MRSRVRKVVFFLFSLALFLLRDCYHHLLCVDAFPAGSSSSSSPVDQNPLHASSTSLSKTISPSLFASLEEFARIVDIAYCVGVAGTGIQKPFVCASRCADFPRFELVTTWHTGVLMGDGCGFLVVEHAEEGQGEGGENVNRKGKSSGKGRIIVAFRGTYSITNTIIDLSTIPQEYVPYPEDPEQDAEDFCTPTSTFTSTSTNIHTTSLKDWLPWPFKRKPASSANSNPNPSTRKPHPQKCTNCTVHSGFLTSWKNTRPYLLPHLSLLKQQYPNYTLHLVGHSLGGAVAALAALELNGRGWRPVVTTFGEPRIGNKALREWLDEVFELDGDREERGEERRYRRVTHVDDPVPLLPLSEWGYRSHAGEVFISKPELQPGVRDVKLCFGNVDRECIAGGEREESWWGDSIVDAASSLGTEYEEGTKDGFRFADGSENMEELQKRWGIPIPARYKLWQLFFAHRDYFWRLGLCLPGGDPGDWRRPRYNVSSVDGGVYGERKGEREEREGL